MKRSSERMLTTHTGSLPRPQELVRWLLEEQDHPGTNRPALDAAVQLAVADVVQKQIACGLDVINDGEQGRTDYTVHVKDRLTGFEGPSKVIIPGVIYSTSNFVEHPELVADRIVQHARLVGRENVIAGVDCGFGTFAGRVQVDSKIVWMKLQSLSEGAKLASRQLW